MNRSPRFPLAASAAALALALTVAHSRAATLAYEGFTAATAGNTNIVGQGGGTGWGGNWNSGQSDGFLHTVRTPTTISYPGYTTSSTPAASAGNFLNLAAGYGGSNPTGVFRAFDTSAGGTFGSNGYLSGGLIGADNKTVWGSILYSNNDTGFGFDTKTLTLNGGGTVNIVLPQSGTSNSNLMIFRIDFGAGNTDTFTYFSNPNLATFDGTTGGVTSAAGNYSFSNLVLTEQGFNFGGQGTETQYDDIRFGTSLGDVAPISSVPEPSTWLAGALLVSTVAGSLLRARRSTALPCTL